MPSSTTPSIAIRPPWPSAPYLFELVLNSPSTSASVRTARFVERHLGQLADGQRGGVAAEWLGQSADENVERRGAQGVAVEQQRLCDPQPLQALDDLERERFALGHAAGGAMTIALVSA